MSSKLENSTNCQNPPEGQTPEQEWTYPEGVRVEWSMKPANQSTPEEREIYQALLEIDRRIAAGEPFPHGVRLECCGGRMDDPTPSQTEPWSCSQTEAQSASPDDISEGRS